jgi:hypothetical protein
LVDRSIVPGFLQSPTVARHADRAEVATMSRLTGMTVEDALLGDVGVFEDLGAFEGVGVDVVLANGVAGKVAVF